MPGHQISSQTLRLESLARTVDAGKKQPASHSDEVLSRSSSSTDVIVLCWTDPRESDRRANKIAAFMGATVRFLTLTPSVVRGDGATSSALPECSCLVVEAETLARIAEAMPTGAAELCRFLEPAEHVFAYGFQSTKAHDAVLQALSLNALAGSRRVSDPGLKLHVSTDQLAWCFQLSGLSIGLADPTKENFFIECRREDELSVLIRIGEKPFLVRCNNHRSKIFLLAGGELADLDRPVTRHCSGLKWFCGLAPFMMFLRGSLGGRVWHNDHPRACFIIDDPLLKRRHGFLRYQPLLETLRRQQAAACIAFIPWNYRRSSRKVVELFLANPELAFLCVHGCDHTGAEFETRDAELLRGKAQLALHRMRKHQQLSGIPCNEIMVFPQGLFSPEALPALKAAGYLAAVNTEQSPSIGSESLSLRDLLDVAVTRFADFPLFGRRYPTDLGEFAFDLFLGKPALAVEHHGYFKDGHAALEIFITQLKALDSRIEWAGLDTVCSQACLSKTSENGDIYVRFYTDRFHLQNTAARGRRYILRHRQASGDQLPPVIVNGQSWSCQRENGELSICVSLEPGQTADIQILSATSQPVVPWRPTKTHDIRVWLRRMLCEIRDNYVQKNRTLQQIVSVFHPNAALGGIQEASTASIGSSRAPGGSLQEPRMLQRWSPSSATRGI